MFLENCFWESLLINIIDNLIVKPLLNMQSTKSIKFYMSGLMLNHDFPVAFNIFILTGNFSKQCLICSNMLPNTLATRSLKPLSSCDLILHPNEVLSQWSFPRLLITGNLHAISFKHLTLGTTTSCPPSTLAATIIPLSNTAQSITPSLL